MAPASLLRHRYARYGGQCLCIGWMLALLCQVAIAAGDRRDTDLSDADQPVLFDIERLPLRQALEGFFRAAGHSLLYDDAITAGKLAGPLKGEFTPEAALRTLLTGTGIVARRTAPTAWMLLDGSGETGSADTNADAAAGAASATASAAYYAALQRAVTRALCADPVTAPGSYRMALRLFIGSGDTIEKVLLHPTGNALRDQRVQTRLSGLRLSLPLPSGVISPVTLIVLPREAAQSDDCAPPRKPVQDAA
ncbi:STN domain-containing protein [Pandoraea communis]|uniref:STN domain-containing protein n=1 Tax=Pandoraea communis TaxID=2508297 RepID=UPI0025A4F28F|nr:STN domain-containing protein [Pandoraea communis]MDM8355861.1 STN domain-containing protein [Pandoraea communis]